MSNYRFKINFYLKGSFNNSLSYDLYNNCAVEDFVKTVEYGSDIPVYNTSMVFSKSETVDKYCELYNQAKQLTKTNVYDNTIGPIDPERVMNGWNQDTLNYLHNYVEEFEYLVGNIDEEELDWLSPIISRFNDNIHYMENDNVGYENSWLSFRMDPFKKIPLREEHMDLFRQGYNARKLYLGYSEVGKTLWHMYEAGDTEAALRKQSNPKNSITNEIFLPYFDTDWEWNDYCDWCEKHAQGVDYKDPREWGQIEIGSLVNPDDYKIQPFDDISVELE